MAVVETRKRKLYLDTGLLIGFYREEDEHHDNAINFFKKTKTLKNLDLVCSEFTITEFAQACVSRGYFSELETHRITEKLLITHKIGRKYPFKMISAKGKEETYSFGDFFVDVKNIILDPRSERLHLADAIHSVIMRNNKIKNVVTYNKQDFSGISGINPHEPDEIV